MKHKKSLYQVQKQGFSFQAGVLVESEEDAKVAQQEILAVKNRFGQ